MWINITKSDKNSAFQSAQNSKRMGVASGQVARFGQSKIRAVWLISDLRLKSGANWSDVEKNDLASDEIALERLDLEKIAVKFSGKQTRERSSLAYSQQVKLPTGAIVRVCTLCYNE